MLPVETKPAPEPLIAVQSFVNTVELATGEELLAAATTARPWLEAAGLMASGARLGEAELKSARQVREALRALLVENAGGPAPSSRALRPLRELTAARGARLAVGPSGRLEFEDEAPGELADGLFGLLLTVRDAQADGTWANLKACADDDCRWAFYDRSRSHRGTWCDMATCGNRAKNRALRARQT